MGQTILHTENLTIGYLKQGHPKKLIQDINVSLQEGQLTCLLGQNGVGKSTLLRTLLDFQQPISGKVFINQKPNQSYTRAALSRLVSVVLTDPVMAGNLSVWELVALGRAPYTAWNGILDKSDWEKVQWAIDSTRINYIQEKKINELSDGQMQKALIARALAQDCPLIIMDEPTAHLDLNNRVEIMKLLKELSETTEKSILVATHELQLTLQLADQLWLTNFNQPLVSGAPEDLALSGQLESTFYHEGFEFDLITGRATIPPKPRREINIQGTGEWLYWTRNALLRKGFNIKSDAPLRVEKTDTNQWYLLHQSEAKKFSTIAELLDFLEGMI